MNALRCLLITAWILSASNAFAVTEKASEKPVENPAEQAQADSAHAPETPHATEAAHATLVKKRSASSEGVCLGSSQVINELKSKQKELDERERALSKQADELKTKEQVLLEEFAKLTKLREEVQSVQQTNQKISEESILKMVDTVEKMSPKSAAQLLSKVNEPLAVETISRISTQKLAKVLAAMDVSKASSLTEGLTKRGTKKEGSI